MPIQFAMQDSIALIRLDNPPVNALSIGAGLVADLQAALNQALTEARCKVILIAGTGRMFCGGADIKDFEGTPFAIEAIRTLMNRIESSPKPVVMALHGMALGGGLELAMAGHYRIAAQGTMFGLPEVTLGILPGGGGTQRLPRLIDAGSALTMMLSGKSIGTDKALKLGLVDRVVDGDVITAALAFIGENADLCLRPTCELPFSGETRDAIAAARATTKKLSLSAAPAHIIICVEAAASGSFANGLATEARLFGELMQSEASRGLRHAFFGQRLVGRIPGQGKDMAARPIRSVGIVGGGLMGTGIAIAVLNADLAVSLVELRPDALEKAGASIRKSLLRDVEKGRLLQEKADARIAAFTPASTLDALGEVDLIIEAVFEDLAIKEQVFGALDAIAKDEAILASNTSTLDLDAIAAFTKRPESVVGLHFFSPANIMKLLEVVRGAKTAPDVLASAMVFAKSIGKVGVVAGVCDGFIGNRIFEEYLRQAWFLLEEGALPQQIDAAMEAWGMAMGPCRTMDLAGQDIGWSIRKRRAVEQPDRPYSKVIDRVCEMGRFGQKTGKGLYLYADGRTATIDPDIDALVISYSAEIGLDRRTINDAEIVSRCLLAMANEGAKIVGEGIAYRPVDVDIIYLNGYGFPAERCGPMFQADEMGLDKVLETIRTYAAGRNGWAWEPAPLLVELAARGSTFRELNQ